MPRSTLLLIALFALPGIAEAQSASPPSGDDDKPIVVTAVRLPVLQDALKACLARRCPPDQDIAATLAVAETQFVDGDYADARTTLLKSIDRNRRFAKDYPEPVSDLLRANYRVAAHLGDGESYRIGTFETVSALKAGLPADDPRVLGAQIEVGDMLARFNRIDEAADQYTRIEKRAAALGLSNVQGLAQLRLVALYSQLAIALPFQYKADARRAAAILTGTADPRMAPFAQAARVLMARLDAKTGDAGAVDRLIADYRTMGRGTVPVLLYAPPIKAIDNGDRARNSGTGTQRLARANYDGEWVDIGFWVAPDGRVTDADILRGGKGPATPDWAKPILAAIGARRYAPLAMDAALPGVLRVERYTLTARLTTYTGSRLVVREPTPQIEMLDLSVDPPAGKSGG